MSFLAPLAVAGEAVAAGAAETAAVGAAETAGAVTGGATAGEISLAEAGSEGNLGRSANLQQGIQDGKGSITQKKEKENKTYPSVTDISAITSGGRYI